MSHDDPLLSKMDALMRKHRGEGDSSPTPAPPPGWLPVLTQVIERGNPPEAPVTSPVAAGHGSSLLAQTPAVSGEALAEQLMRELAPRLAEALEKQVTAELRKNLDQTVARVLSQLDVTMREIVRDAVAEKLKPPPGSP